MFFQVLKEFFKIQWEFISRKIKNFASTVLNSDTIGLFGIFVLGVITFTIIFGVIPYYVGKLMVTKFNITIQSVVEDANSNFDLYLQHGFITILTCIVVIFLTLVSTYITLALVGKIQSTWRKARKRVEGDDVIPAKDSLQEYIKLSDR